MYVPLKKIEKERKAAESKLTVIKTWSPVGVKN